MLFEQISRNKRRTALILTIFVLILALVGAAVGYFVADSMIAGIIIAVIGTGIYLAIVLHDPAQLVMSMNNAEEIHEQDNPELWHIVEDMAMVARVPMPRVYIIDDASPNAFATGRDPEHASVAVTRGLLEMMNREELEGVLGHELSHVRNYDILVSTIAIAMLTVITLLTDFTSRYLFWFGGSRRDRDDDDNDNKNLEIIKIVLFVITILLAPLAATLINLALSRNREYLADAGSVELTRNPHGLISALKKIENSQPMENVSSSSRALYIEDPVKKEHSSLFDTHPPTSERIKRLEQM
ncbi:zinc metalloprotease HtpX [Lactobacillus jensenii]|jgi:protease htpX homolog|uniref:Protease HtpX homolog n=2 Tax=Lactobacillales TaxID=186826 RepID=A0A5N1IG56_LACJE|nr:zinc metalloprotease HtpX [Lactobacillus jensenii]EEQ67992.1 peptidase, M48 family [Lactobacillus jensenii 1153]ERJ41845.1 heat shock protein HtpX [Lactobacillus jensenii MD IIE-70(2)]APT13964.1 zinc metalloprotease HtpX [Lactobacillus jensenii]EEQ23865.1 peptidase, M48 family [Lactobacillus jensenii 269-3]EEX27019.1 peptidase, M48 family [Lactobacillus jensenii SJ-7A-US]